MKKVLKVLLILVVVFIVLVLLFNFIKKKDNQSSYDPTENFLEIQWPSSALAQRLPSPGLTYGEFKHEQEDSFCVYFGNVTREKFDEYVEQCKAAGYDTEPHVTDTVYWSYDAEGYYLYLRYDAEYSVMDIETRCPDQSEDTTTKAPSTTANSGSIGADFKAAMDAYEKFMNDYVDFMKKYKANPTDMTLIQDYTDFLSDYGKFTQEFSTWKSKDLNAAELQYYTEVQSRVSKKLLEVAG